MKALNDCVHHLASLYLCALRRKTYEDKSMVISIRGLGVFWTFQLQQANHYEFDLSNFKPCGLDILL